MKLSAFDISIVFVYLLSTVVIGLIIKQRASKNLHAYLLGSNKLPWYMLGLSNASCMFDLSGTMWLVTAVFVYGLKSIWLPWLWPAFNQVFLMVFLSVWLRRSNVRTGAEWIATRFNKDKQRRLAHGIIVAFALLSCLGFLAYGFIGIGKFVQIFIPWESIEAFVPFSLPKEFIPHFYGVIFTLIAVFYTILGGMTSIVWTDIIQYFIIFISAIVVGLIAMDALASHPLNVPKGWHNPFFGWKLNLDWTGIINEVNQKINKDGFSLFSAFFMMMLFKGVLVSLAGPAPNYDMQKILSTKSPKEAAKMSGLVSVVLMPARYFMITGFAVLAIIYYDKLHLSTGGEVDFEQILPSAINEFIPVGFMGLILAGLLAAFMSSFAGTLNVAQAYIVNDIFKHKSSKKHFNNKIHLSYFAGIFVVLVSIFLGFFVENINSMMQWIVSALYGSYVASNILKWYWWRFNASGYFWGMVAGIIPALILPVVFHNTLELYYFPILLLLSLIGCIIGTYTHPPTDEETLKTFYKTVHPWGFWEPIYKKVKIEDPGFVRNKSLSMDIFNIVIGIVAQTTLVIIPIYIVLMETTPLFISILILATCIIILKKTWWNKLDAEKSEKKYKLYKTLNLKTFEI